MKPDFVMTGTDLKECDIHEDSEGNSLLPDTEYKIWLHPFKAIKKNMAAVELGRLGGQKGGKARSLSLTPERRKEIASKAAKSRWGNNSQ